jgi:hypothetical protein
MKQVAGDSALGNLQKMGDSRFENNSLNLQCGLNENLNLELNNTQISHKLLLSPVLV